MNFPCVEDVVPVFKMFGWFDSLKIFYILSVFVRSYVKTGFRLSDILYIYIYICIYIDIYIYIYIYMIDHK